VQPSTADIEVVGSAYHNARPGGLFAVRFLFCQQNGWEIPVANGQMDQLTMAGWEIHLDEGGNGTLHTLRGASGQVDILRLGWIAVTLELGDEMGPMG